ncbi:hypothetical protein FB45DRAFT_869228 [Roridomyces roridus]|uniref:Uncharacterized protein n=1 Tax=Roridomyces roridus TaxID=1738132 RepID=A0AAD7FL64_9AGAR|nr:hypothetical protein FB45DRAFT_869228 [Roridomyces roridus]
MYIMLSEQAGQQTLCADPDFETLLLDVLSPASAADGMIEAELHPPSLKFRDFWNAVCLIGAHPEVSKQLLWRAFSILIRAAGADSGVSNTAVQDMSMMDQVFRRIPHLDKDVLKRLKLEEYTADFKVVLTIMQALSADGVNQEVLRFLIRRLKPQFTWGRQLAARNLLDLWQRPAFRHHLLDLQMTVLNKVRRILSEGSATERLAALTRMFSDDIGRVAVFKAGLMNALFKHRSEEVDDLLVHVIATEPALAQKYSSESRNSVTIVIMMKTLLDSPGDWDLEKSRPKFQIVLPLATHIPKVTPTDVETLCNDIIQRVEAYELTHTSRRAAAIFLVVLFVCNRVEPVTQIFTRHQDSLTNAFGELQYEEVWNALRGISASKNEQTGMVTPPDQEILDRLVQAIRDADDKGTPTWEVEWAIRLLSVYKPHTPQEALKYRSPGENGECLSWSLYSTSASSDLGMANRIDCKSNVASGASLVIPQAPALRRLNISRLIKARDRLQAPLSRIECLREEPMRIVPEGVYGRGVGPEFALEDGDRGDGGSSPFDGLTATRCAYVQCGYSAYFALDSLQLPLESAGEIWGGVNSPCPLFGAYTVSALRTTARRLADENVVPTPRVNGMLVEAQLDDGDVEEEEMVVEAMRV